MFGLGFPEILILLVIIFLLFGAKRIPEIGSALGKTVQEIRKIRDEKKSDKEKEKGEEKGAEKGGNLISDIKKEVDALPGLKEAKKIKESAAKIKNLTKMLR